MAGFGYAKIFQDIFYSSLAAHMEARHIFVDLCVLADENGEVMMSLEAIARVLNYKRPIDELREIFDYLSKPDPNSKNDQEDGRRIIPLVPSRGDNCGWRVVSHGIYRDMVNKEKRRKQWRDSKRKGRAEARVAAQGVHKKSTKLNKSPPKQETGNKKQEANKQNGWGEAPTAVDPKAWREWAEYKTGSPYKGTVTRVANLLSKESPENQRKIVDESIKNGWKGLFPLRGNGNGRSKEGGADRIRRVNAEAAKRIIDGTAEPAAN